MTTFYTLFLNECEDLQQINYFLPKGCIEECAIGGDNQEAVAHWADMLGLEWPREFCVEICIQNGALEEEDFDTWTDKSLIESVLWLAAWYDQ